MGHGAKTLNTDLFNWNDPVPLQGIPSNKCISNKITFQRLFLFKFSEHSYQKSIVMIQYKIAENNIVRDVRFILLTTICNNTNGKRIDTVAHFVLLPRKLNIWLTI